MGAKEEIASLLQGAVYESRGVLLRNAKLHPPSRTFLPGRTSASEGHSPDPTHVISKLSPLESVFELDDQSLFYYGYKHR